MTEEAAPTTYDLKRKLDIAGKALATALARIEQLERQRIDRAAQNMRDILTGKTII